MIGTKLIPSLEEVELICHGNAVFDVNILTKEACKPNLKYHADTLSYNGGGVAPNIAVAASRLGGKVGFSGCLSDDCFGQIQYDELKSEGINLESAVRSTTASSVSVIIGQPDGNSILTGKLFAPQPVHWPIAPAINPKMILLDGSLKESSLGWLALARERQITTIFNGGYISQDAFELAKRVDIVVCSREFAAAYSQSSDLEIILKKAPTLCKHFIVTLDREGLAWSWNGKQGLMGAWQVKCLDGVGAGDAFHGSFCMGLLEGLPFEDNLLKASASGAICCTGLGARTALPDAEAVQKFMADQTQPEIVFL